MPCVSHALQLKLYFLVGDIRAHLLPVVQVQLPCSFLHELFLHVPN